MSAALLRHSGHRGPGTPPRKRSLTAQNKRDRYAAAVALPAGGSPISSRAKRSARWCMARQPLSVGPGIIASAWLSFHRSSAASTGLERRLVVHAGLYQPWHTPPRGDGLSGGWTSLPLRGLACCASRWRSIVVHTRSPPSTPILSIAVVFVFSRRRSCPSPCCDFPRMAQTGCRSACSCGSRCVTWLASLRTPMPSSTHRAGLLRPSAPN